MIHIRMKRQGRRGRESNQILFFIVLLLLSRKLHAGMLSVLNHRNKNLGKADLEGLIEKPARSSLFKIYTYEEI